MIDLDDLTERLRNLGDALDFDDAELAESVLGRIDAEPRRRNRLWMVVAAAVLLVLVGVAVIPDSRRAVARWFGLEGVTVEIDSDLSATPAAPVSFDMPGPGQSRVVNVDGREILISTISGTLTPRMITKSVQSPEQVREVDVDGAPGLWIDGLAHEIGYESPPGHVVFERMAGNTLLWQRGDTLTRVEGFDDVDAALAFARPGGIDFEHTTDGNLIPLGGVGRACDQFQHRHPLDPARLLVAGLLALVVAVSASSASAGGWAVASLDALPNASAGQSVDVGFTVLQHGQTPAVLDSDVGIELVSPTGRCSSSQPLRMTCLVTTSPR